MIKRALSSLFQKQQQQPDASLLDCSPAAPSAPSLVDQEADDLYRQVTQGLKVGQAAKVLDVARRLYEIDPIAERAVSTYALCALEAGLPMLAEQAISHSMEQAGKTPTLLTLLARVYQAQGDERAAHQALAAMAAMDPNYQNGMMWWLGILQQAMTPADYRAELERIAALPESWLVPMILGQMLSREGDLDGAMALYQKTLDRGHISNQVLVTVSTDLGKHNCTAQALAMIKPLFDPAQHDLAVASNIALCHLTLGQTDAAASFVDNIRSLNRPDAAEFLAYYDQAIAQQRKAQPDMGQLR